MGHFFIKKGGFMVKKVEKTCSRCFNTLTIIMQIFLKLVISYACITSSSAYACKSFNLKYIFNIDNLNYKSITFFNNKSL